MTLYWAEKPFANVYIGRKALFKFRAHSGHTDERLLVEASSENTPMMIMMIMMTMMIMIMMMTMMMMTMMTMMMTMMMMMGWLKGFGRIGLNFVPRRREWQ